MRANKSYARVICAAGLTIWAAFFVAVSSAFADPFSRAQVQSINSVPFPRGVADRRRGVAYLTNQAGAVDSIGLRDGRLLWSSAQASRPLLAWDTYLLAQAPTRGVGNTLRMVLLDVEKRGALVRSSLVTFPDWVDVTDANTDSFAYEVREENGSVFLSWRAALRKGGGPLSSPNQIGRKSAAGVFHIDLSTGTVEAQESGHTEAQIAEALAAFSDAELAPYHRGYEQASAPWLTGNKAAAVVRTGSSGSEELSLRTYDLTHGRKSGEVRLAGGAGSELSLSLDGRHLLVGAPPQGGILPGVEAWQVYAVGGVESARRIEIEGRLAECVVIDDKLFALVDLSGGRDGLSEGPHILLRCYGLNNGRLFWERRIVGPGADAPPKKKRMLR